jgi:peptidoglycan/xylan/chitin deacetylase (PgdA/CDA1 family)
MLLTMTAEWQIPLTLAVIPKPAGSPLAERLLSERHVNIAVHGWAHENHAPPDQKKQEMGAHRPLPVVIDEVWQGIDRLSRLFPQQFVPVVVPPWNRIAPAVIAALPRPAVRALSVFGPEAAADLPMINTHVDLIDWRGTRGGRADAALHADLIAALNRGGPVGLLTHHLVHDALAWGFMQRLFALTADHPGCCWTALPTLLPSGSP